MSLAVVISLSLWLAAYIIFCLFLLILLLACKSLRNQVTHWFIINGLVANLLFSLLVRPGTIGAEIAHRPTADIYCNFYIILHHVEQLAVPALLLMITVDRMIYVRDPDSYGQKMTTSVIVTMLALPWLLSFILGLVSVFGFSSGMMVQNLYIDGNMTERFVCEPEVSAFYRNMMTFQAVMCLFMALASLLVTVLILSFCCRHRRALTYNQVYSQLEAEVASFVTQAAILVCSLNLLFLAMFVCHFLIMELVDTVMIDTHVIYFLFEMFEVILWVCLLPDLRRAVSQMCCKCLDRSSEQHPLQTTLHYVANAEET